MDLKDMIPAASKMDQRLHLHDREAEELAIKSAKLIIKESFDSWHAEKSQSDAILVRAYIPSQVQKELKNLGYKVQVRLDDCIITW